MTAPAQESRPGRAAAVFLAFAALAFGGVGLVVAALAVGTERAWTGGRVEAQRARQRRQSWLERQRAWIDADHDARAARARAYTDWLRSGANPTSRPDRPSWWQRIRDGVRRGVANTAISAVDFREGFGEGWRAAQEVRRQGGGFREIATARPGVQQPDGDTTEGAPPVNAPAPQPEPEAVDVAVPATETPTDQPTPADGSPAPATPFPSQLRNQFREDTTMTQPTTTAQSQPQAESNATVLRALLAQIAATLHQVSENTDALAALRNKLDQLVARADEHAANTGQSAQSRQSLDEAREIVALLGQHLSAFSEGAVNAEDQVQSASDGLRLVENAEDELRQSGADGRAVAPAMNA